MKRIEAIVPSNRLNFAVAAMEEFGATGITVIEAKGREIGRAHV